MRAIGVPGTGLPSLAIDHREVERRKQFRRDLWEYRPVDHIPVTFWPNWTFGYTPREATENGDVQLEVNVRTIERSLRVIPDDYIPWARIWCGYMTVATMFGAEVHWGDDPAQAPGCPRSPGPRDRPGLPSRAPGHGCRPDAGEPASPAPARGQRFRRTCISPGSTRAGP